MIYYNFRLEILFLLRIFILKMIAFVCHFITGQRQYEQITPFIILFILNL